MTTSCLEGCPDMCSSLVVGQTSDEVWRGSAVQPRQERNTKKSKEKGGNSRKGENHKMHYSFKVT